MNRTRLTAAALAVTGLAILAPAPSAQAVECCGRVANLSSSSASIRAYDNRYSTTRFKAGNCLGGYVNVQPNSVTGVLSDFDCIRMMSGTTKVTGIIEIRNALTMSLIASTNVGCTSNRVDGTVQGHELGRVLYARKCV